MYTETAYLGKTQRVFLRMEPKLERELHVTLARP